MAISYNKIYQDVNRLIKKYGTRDPKALLELRKVSLIAFRSNTKVLGMYKIIKRNRFVFYNPYVDKRIINMVLAHELGHDLYHRKEASGVKLIEYELFDITSSMELEANLFASHLLIDEREIADDLKIGYTYDQLASKYNVNVNLMIFKLNEMHRLGYPIRKETQVDNKLFTKINGYDLKNQKNL